MASKLLKGVGSLFPPNTIANKLASGTKIDSTAIKNAVKDVSGSVTGQRGILGGNTPSINLASLIPGGGAVSSALATLSKTGSVSSYSQPTTTLGGINTLAPSTISNASALAQQSSVSKSLYAGATGSIPNSTPEYATDFTEAVQDDKGIKNVPLDENGNPKKKTNWTMYLVVGVVVVYLITKK
jgi:hypothetical protein